MRDKFSISIEHGIADYLRTLSDVTKISVSKLLDEAIEDLIIKYDLPSLIEEHKKKQKAKEELNKKLELIKKNKLD